MAEVSEIQFNPAISQDSTSETVAQPDVDVKDCQGVSNIILAGTSHTVEGQETIEVKSFNCHNDMQDERPIAVGSDLDEIAHAILDKLDLVKKVIAEGGLDPPGLDAIAAENSDDKFSSSPTLSDSPSNESLGLLQQLSNETELLEAKHAVVQDKSKQEKGNRNEKLQKKDPKSKQKEERNIENIMKTISGLNSPEEKIAMLCKKYAELLEENRIAANSVKQSERRNIQLQREKEQIQSDHSKAVLTRSRLESLCRELQRQNKVVKDESLMRVREEEEKRKEVSAKFQTTLSEITNMLQDNNQKSSKLQEENMELAQKLKSLIEQYEIREQQVDKVVKHKELEAQLAEAKLAKANMMLAEEREKFLREKHKCLQDLSDYQKRCQEMAANEVQLRTQLSLYTDKYEEFQSTLTKSNQVFSHFKSEMDKMSKKIKKLEKETGTWRQRWESSNAALVNMAADKQKRDQELMNGQKKIVQLEKLCRAMQTERQTLLAQLKSDKGPEADTNLIPDSDYMCMSSNDLPLDSAEVESTQLIEVEQNEQVANGKAEDEVCNQGIDSSSLEDADINKSESTDLLPDCLAFCPDDDLANLASQLQPDDARSTAEQISKMANILASVLENCNMGDGIGMSPDTKCPKRDQTCQPETVLESIESPAIATPKAKEPKGKKKHKSAAKCEAACKPESEAVVES